MIDLFQFLLTLYLVFRHPRRTTLYNQPIDQHWNLLLSRMFIHKTFNKHDSFSKPYLHVYLKVAIWNIICWIKQCTSCIHSSSSTREQVAWVVFYVTFNSFSVILWQCLLVTDIRLLPRSAASMGYGAANDPNTNITPSHIILTPGQPVLILSS